MYRSFRKSYFVLLQKEGRIFVRRNLQAFWGQKRAWRAEPEDAGHRASLLSSQLLGECNAN